MRMRRTPQSAPDEKLAFEYAKSAIAEFGAWVKNADTKATVLAAGFGAVSTITAGRFSAVLTVIFGGSEGWRILVAVAGVAFIVAAVITIWFLTRALIPRKNVSGGRNAFAWPSVADSFEANDKEFSRASAEMAWAQAHALAKIAKAKFAAFRAALFSFVALIVFAAILLGVASAVTTP
ncbi:hypothetical protein [Curtobacterium flaccumfaciens]|uniref:hypothetical protein n=1 Tax=Curtobacterium flaccumfaciens TaxID=2035 RepID=UPI001ADC1853|nr:hypothetical protein [Curtobacterium flaccumfaciens]MBO9049534.1 hypothetical protein [Curtobacterium flaccumfaciens pv. flaccumfaciens]